MTLKNVNIYSFPSKAMKVDYNLISSKEINEVREWTVFQVFILIFPLWLYLGEGVWYLGEGVRKRIVGE